MFCLYQVYCSIPAVLSRVNLYTLQADGIYTVFEKIEDEPFFGVYVDHSAVGHKLRMVNISFSVRGPHSGDAKGLFDCLKLAVKDVGLPNEWNKKLVGFGCDGTSVNLGEPGLKMHLHPTAPG